MMSQQCHALHKYQQFKYDLITDRVVRYCCQNWYFRNKQQRPLTTLSRKLLPAHWLEFQDDWIWPGSGRYDIRTRSIHGNYLLDTFSFSEFFTCAQHCHLCVDNFQCTKKANHELTHNFIQSSFSQRQLSSGLLIRRYRKGHKACHVIYGGRCDGI